MFGRPSISRNTDLDQGSVKELLVQADDFMANLRNFVESRRVQDKARMISQNNPNNEIDDNVAELRNIADNLATLMYKLEDNWMDGRRSLEEETETEELTEMFGRGPKIKPRSGFNDATTEAFLEVIQEAFENIQNYAGAPAIRASVGGTKMQKHLNAIRQLATKMMDESIKFDNEYLTWKNEDLEFNMTEETDLEEDEDLEEGRTRAGDAARVAGTVAGYEVGNKAGGDIGAAIGKTYQALTPRGAPGKYSAARIGRSLGGGVAGKAAGAVGGYMAGDEVAYRARLEHVEEDLSTPVETVSLTEEAVKDIKKKIQRKFKKGDDIRYIDARDHEERTGKYKGLKFMGGRSYAQVETGKELLALPVFQIVLD